MPPYIIAGIDPGATMGVAVLDLSGRKISTGSFLGGGISEATRFIERHGTPSIVACDVSPIPDAALRMASFFSCRAHSPAREIREEEKKAIAHGAGLANNHERDAYAAAVLAYRSHANKFRQIDALPELTDGEKDRLKHLMLRGYRLKDAFLELKEPEKGQAEAKEEGKPSARFISADELKERASSLARENANLRLLVARMENERQQLESRLRLFENGVRQSMLRDSELRRLRFQLQQTLGRLKTRPKQSKNPHRQGRPQKSPQVLHGQYAQAERQGPVPPNQQKQRSSTAQNDDLNSLVSPKLDLEKLVTEYRRGKKQA